MIGFESKMEITRTGGENKEKNCKGFVQKRSNSGKSQKYEKLFQTYKNSQFELQIRNNDS